MAALEACLLIIGVVLVFASFFVSEKLSSREVDKLAGLTKEEMNQMVSKEIKNAEDRIKDTIDEQIEESVVKVSRDMEKVSNDKISNISEFSDSVIESINKNHSEVMFLYSMLTEKEEELKGSVSEAQSLHTTLNQDFVQAEEVQEKKAQEEERQPVFTEMKVTPLTVPTVTDAGEDNKVIRSFFMEQGETAKENAVNENNNDAILTRYRKGKTVIQIAKELGLGQGEVKLVIDLYEGGRR